MEIFLVSWDSIEIMKEKLENLIDDYFRMELPSELNKLPQELIMRILLPFCDIVSLRKLSMTSKKWNDNVNIFLKDFNKVIQLDTTKIKIGKYFHFATHLSSKLVKLELNWNYGSHKECDYLHQVLENNKVRSIFFVLGSIKFVKLSLSLSERADTIITLPHNPPTANFLGP